jgi:hypothetical protein
MATGARIEAYSYSDGSAQWESTHSLTVNLGGAVKVRHSTPQRLEEALASWKAALDTAKPAGAPWALSYSSTTKRVTIASAGPIFSLAFPGTVGQWLGFTAGTVTGAATYTGDSAPAGLVQCAVGAELPEAVERTDTTAIRHGRAYSYAWWQIDRWTFDVMIDRGAYPWQAQQSRDYSDPAGGWVLTGRVRVYGSAGSASVFSASNVSGYVDGFVSAAESEVVAQGERWLRVRLTVLAPSGATSLAEPTGLWGAVRYGWQPIYWLTIAGIPTVWSERASGLTLPSGWATEAALLDIDGSAPIGSTIDRSRGLGTGLPLSFRLRDGAAIAAYQRRPSAESWLKVGLTATATTATVQSATDFDATGTAYCGIETLTYTGKSPTTLTGLGRGAAGSTAVAHAIGGVGQQVTSTPTVWAGRDVRLYALACDPTGTATGTALADDSAEVWRGRLTGQAVRQVGCWEYRADALDRVLDRKLGGKQTGTVIGYGSAITVNPQWTFGAYLEGLKSNGAPECGPFQMAITPFAAYTAGEVISSAEAIQAIQDAWSAEVTAQGYGAHLSTALQVDTLDSVVDGVKMVVFQPVFVAHVNLAVIKVHNVWWGSWKAKPAWFPPGGFSITGDFSATDTPVSCWGGVLAGDVTQLWSPNAASKLTKALIVQPDDGDASPVDAAGYLQIATPAGKQLLKYQAVTAANSAWFFELKAGQSPAPVPAGSTATVWSSVGPADLETLMLTAIQSSGAGSQGAYDSGSQGTGYAIAAVDEAGFSAQAGGMGLKASVSTAGASFADLFGGALALSQRAVVQRVDDGVCRLGLVPTAPYGSGPTETITDWHLLHVDAEPVESVERLAPPNAIEVERIVGPDQGDDESASMAVTAIDRVSVAAIGQVSERWSVPAESREQLLQVVQAQAASIFGGQQDCQAATLRVVPWVEAQPGDLVYLRCSHPLLWNYATAAHGYSGKARVTGRSQALLTGEVELTVLLEGRADVRGLCPSARVIAFDSAAAPMWIDVDLKYLPHFAAAIAAAGSAVDVLHYWPGDTEGTAQQYSLSAAVASGGYCRLTVSAQVGAFSLSTSKRSSLTLPVSGAGTPFQDRFSHVDDGSRWG